MNTSNISLVKKHLRYNSFKLGFSQLKLFNVGNNHKGYNMSNDLNYYNSDENLSIMQNRTINKKASNMTLLNTNNDMTNYKYGNLPMQSIGILNKQRSFRDLSSLISRDDRNANPKDFKRGKTFLRSATFKGLVPSRTETKRKSDMKKATEGIKEDECSMENTANSALLKVAVARKVRFSKQDNSKEIVSSLASFQQLKIDSSYFQNSLGSLHSEPEENNSFTKSKSSNNEKNDFEQDSKKSSDDSDSRNFNSRVRKLTSILEFRKDDIFNNDSINSNDEMRDKKRSRSFINHYSKNIKVGLDK